MKFKRKKNVKFTAETLCLGLFTLFCVMAISCERYEPQKDDPPIKDSCNCIMDTLKGEWRWVKIYGSFWGVTDSIEFKSIIKILNQNADSSINYQVFVADTLFYEGSFQIQRDEWNRMFVNIELPHETWRNIVWQIFFGDMLTRISDKNTLCFKDDAEDGYIYYYQKIK